MTHGAKTGLLALCAAVLLAAHASATAPSIPTCRSGFVMMTSPHHLISCVSVSTARALEGYGWDPNLQPFVRASELPVSSTPESEGLDYSWQPRTNHNMPSASPSYWVTSSPKLPLKHHNTEIELPKYPVVGEVADIAFIAEYTDYTPEFFGNDAYPLAKIDVASTQPGQYRIFDIVANIETGDEDTFAPYDFETTTVVAAPEEYYVLKAKLEILREGVADISMRGFDGDILRLPVAASREKSMSYYEYVETGQTYLDKLWAADAAASSYTWGEVKYSGSRPAPPSEDGRTEETGRDWSTAHARYSFETDPPEVEAARNMLDAGYGEGKAAYFLVYYMGYDPELVEQIDTKRLLASLYAKYDRSEGEIIGDLLHRYYEPGSIREFFAGYLGYAPDRAASLDTKNAAAVREDPRIEEVLRRWGYPEDLVREFLAEYTGRAAREARMTDLDYQAEPRQATGSLPTPYGQRSDAVQLESLRCGPSMTPVESPGSDPACVTDQTAQILLERGWTMAAPSDDLQ